MQIAPERFLATLLILWFVAQSPAVAQLPDGFNPDNFDAPPIPDGNSQVPAIPSQLPGNPAGIVSGRFEFASSPNPVGSGARAIGMGGAFIGVADDATAASWNPGGLVQLRTPEISVVYSGVHRIEDNSFHLNSEADGGESITESDINYLSAVYPFNLFNRNMVISLNYQRLYDFARSWDFSTVDAVTKDIEFGDIVLDTITSTTTSRYWNRVNGSLSALGLAYSIQIIPDLSLGVTLNLWDDDLTHSKWESKNDVQTETVWTSASSGISGQSRFLTTIKDHYTFQGMNFNIGAIWRVADELTIGMVFKSPFTADIEHERTATVMEDDQKVTDIRSASDEKMRMPMSYGIGLAWRTSDRLTVSLDFFRTHWEDLEMEDEMGDKTSPVTAKAPDDSDIDPTHQIRLGMEYLFIDPAVDYVIPLRWGLFYDPAPAQGSPDDYYGFSLGAGFAKGPVIFDLAYQFRYGNDVGRSLVVDTDFSQDATEHLLYSSLIFHF